MVPPLTMHACTINVIGKSLFVTHTVTVYNYVTMLVVNRGRRVAKSVNFVFLLRELDVYKLDGGNYRYTGHHGYEGTNAISRYGLFHLAS